MSVEAEQFCAVGGGPIKEWQLGSGEPQRLCHQHPEVAKTEGVALMSQRN